MAHGKKDYSVYMRPQYVNIYYMLAHNYYLNMHVCLLKYISCLVLSLVICSVISAMCGVYSAAVLCTGSSKMTVKEYELIAQANKQPISWSICLGPALEDRKSRFCHAAAKEISLYVIFIIRFGHFDI